MARPPAHKPGDRFGRLTLVRDSGLRSGTNIIWECICDCGSIHKANSSNLGSGRTNSCGCLQREQSSSRSATLFRTHGHNLNKQDSPTYVSYRAMRRRIFDSKHKDYHNYGGRGITICERWMEGFHTFFSDMGERPEGTSLDRIDVNGNYEPNNCRWADSTTQRMNTRNSLLKGTNYVS